MKTQENSQPALPKETLLDLETLRLGQDFGKRAASKKALITIPVRKPGRQDFVRVHPDPDWRLQTAVLELKEERETYLVSPALRDELANEIIPKVLFTSINRQGVISLWPVRLPGEDGRHDAWNQSALEAAQEAETKWVRVAANMSLGAYDVYIADGEIADPEWPDISFQEVVTKAFKDRFIKELNHPVLQRLRGEV